MRAVDALLDRYDPRAVIPPTLLLTASAAVAAKRVFGLVFQKEFWSLVWGELNDPADFAVQSILLCFYENRRSVDPALWFIRRVYLVSGAVIVIVALLWPAVTTRLGGGFDTGDPFAYAVTLVLGGVFTLIPGQVYAVRARTRAVRRYPTGLRIGMWLLEFALFVVAVVVLAKAEATAAVTGIASGVVAVAVAEFAAASCSARPGSIAMPRSRASSAKLLARSTSLPSSAALISRSATVLVKARSSR